ncbi:MAG: HAMP domain-containing histidine kinase [Eubacterium sp.]|nr:HAMP domain-containing histidine kinase [Eubacterium sp.]
MKVIKNKGFRVGLYILGFVTAVLSIFSYFACFFMYGHFSDEDKFDGPYETSDSVVSSIYSELDTLQRKANTEKKLYDVEFLDNSLELYDYTDLIKNLNGKNSSDKRSKFTVGNLLGTEEAIKKLSVYIDNEGGAETIYGAYPNMAYSNDHRYIRMTWAEYIDIVHDRCIKYSYKYDDLCDYGEESPDLDLNEYEQNLYQKLSENYPDNGICDGNYFTFINDYLYMWDMENDLLYYAKYGNASMIPDVNMLDYVYFPYVDIDTFEDLDAFEDYILSSYIYRNDIELCYSTLNDYQKAQISQETDIYNYYTYGCNTAFSVDGERVSRAWIYDQTGLTKINDSMSSGYNETYPEMVDIFRQKSDIFICYDAKSRNIEQWYKNDKGEAVPYEYINSQQLNKLTSECNEDFVLSINLSSEYSDHIWDKAVYNYTSYYSNPLWILVTSILVFLAVVALLIIGEPKKLYIVDKAPYIVWAGLYSGYMLLVCGLIVTLSFSTHEFAQFIFKHSGTAFALAIITILLTYAFTAAVVMNLVRRIKCHKFLDGFVTIWAIKLLRKIYKKNRDRLSGKKITIIFVISYILINIILIGIICCYSIDSEVIVFAGLLVTIDIIAAFIIFRYLTDIEKILKVSKSIEAGELDAKVDLNDLTFNSREMGSSLNNLGDGLSKAVDSSIRDERTKAELITNVSHDIKTPLTSIINYVDLLKKEDIDNEKAREYITVLDQKSARLKQLILDLIEASKTSTGNIELECMNLNFAELLNQGLGEYEDKFTSASLEVCKNIQAENAVIYADGRRVFRVIDNLLNNIVKYAQPNTRVYIDLSNKDSNVILSVKNVSKEMLNITAQELTERFVRGDRSRNTEGSGLGLSIAKNLVELQGGVFDISIDGDLFRVDIIFPLAK